jgi:hypothetical protein
MLDWFYEIPLWIPVTLAIGGLILFWTGLQRLEARLRVAGMIVVIAAIALGAASWILESDREIVERQTRELLASIDKRDWNKTEQLLHPDFAIAGFGNRQQILADLKRYSQEYELQNVRVFNVKAAKPNPKIIATLTMLAELQKSPTGLIGWQLEWEKTSAGWQLLSADSPTIDLATVQALTSSGRR